MGGGRWSATDWTDYTTRAGYASKSTDRIFSSRSLDKDLNPHGVAIRESRDSEDNPNSNALIVALDVTGSMGFILDAMARKGLNTLVSEVYDRKPITDPHIMCMGIGDAEMHDEAPLQVTQFEADLRITKQLEKIYLERGGGGNSYESYMLAWYFAAMHTSIDCFEKRKKKGYLFTIGDEGPTPILYRKDIERVLGSGPQEDIKANDLLTMVSRQYHVFHVMAAEGSHYRSCGDRVRQQWTDILGQRALLLKDHTKLSEVIVSAIQVNEGANVDEVVESWDGSTSLVVREAVTGLSKTSRKVEGIVTL